MICFYIFIFTTFKGMSTLIKNCNYSCTCNRDDCDRKHYIEDKSDRISIKQLFDRYYERGIHNETDPDGVRNVPCFFGPLCSKNDCNFKHYCSYDFRKEIMNKEWRKLSRKENKEKLLDELQKKYSISDEDMERLVKFI